MVYNNILDFFSYFLLSYLIDLMGFNNSYQ